MTADGLRLHVEAHGDGVPVLLSCGYATPCEIFRPQVAPLVEAGARVLLWDYRGHGRSEAPRDPGAYSMARVLDDLGRVLAWGAGETPAVLVGFSFGGLASLHFALAHPDRVRGLVLLASGPGFKNPDAQARWEAQTRRTAELLETEGFGAFLAGRGGDTVVGRRRASEAARAAAAAVAAQDPAAVAQFGRLVSGPAPGVLDELGRVDVPALVVVGEDDPAFARAAEVMAARLPGAKLVRVPGAGHVLSLEAPEQTSALLVRFVRDVGPGPGASG
jgi:pimeloyl-ACP methyl ester carboxylesterase